MLFQYMGAFYTYMYGTGADMYESWRRPAFACKCRPVNKLCLPAFLKKKVTARGFAFSQINGIVSLLMHVRRGILSL